MGTPKYPHFPVDGSFPPLLTDPFDPSFIPHSTMQLVNGTGPGNASREIYRRSSEALFSGVNLGVSTIFGPALLWSPGNRGFLIIDPGGES